MILDHYHCICWNPSPHDGTPTFIPLAATAAVLALFGTHLFPFGFGDDGPFAPGPGPVNVYLQSGDLSQNIVAAR